MYGVFEKNHIRVLPGILFYRETTYGGILHVALKYSPEGFTCFRLESILHVLHSGLFDYCLALSEYLSELY